MSKYKIIRAYTRRYRDTGQVKAYVEWSDGSRTEGDAYNFRGLFLPEGTHMGALFDRALRDGLAIEHDDW
jgi:hypothetical protein